MDKGIRKPSRLTRQDIDAAQPEARPYRLQDTKQPGLFLRVQPSGAKLWNVQWSRRTSKSLGRYPVVTLEMARERARKALVERDQHGAPLSVRAAPATAQTLLVDFINERYAPWLHSSKRKNPKADLAEMKALFESAFYSLPLGEITVGRAELWGAARRTADVKPSTVRRNLVRLKAVLAKAAEWEVLPASPLANLKLAKGEDSGVVRFLSDDEESRLRAAMVARDARMVAARDSANMWRSARAHEPLPALQTYGDHLTPLVLTAINTGMRRGELTGITWANVDLQRKVVTIPKHIAKSSKTRHVPLNSEAVAVLTAWKALDLHPGEPRPFPIRSPKTAWASLMSEAKIDKFRFHDLRHHFASRLVMSGVDLNSVRELLGHADIATTLIYAHLSPGHKANAVEVLVRGDAPSRAPAEAMKILDQIGDQQQLRELMKRLAAKLGAPS